MEFQEVGKRAKKLEENWGKVILFVSRGTSVVIVMRLFFLLGRQLQFTSKLCGQKFHLFPNF